MLAIATGSCEHWCEIPTIDLYHIKNLIYSFLWGFPRGASGKASAC